MRTTFRDEVFALPINLTTINQFFGLSLTPDQARAHIAALPRSQRRFELLIVSHIDNDHIDGALELLADRTLGVTFDDVWFNGYHHTAAAPRRRGIVVTELPYNVGPERVIDRIKDAVLSKKLQGISDVVDLTDGDSGLQLVIVCEDSAHYFLATELADRVLLHEAQARGADWIDPDSLAHLRSFAGHRRRAPSRRGGVVCCGVPTREHARARRVRHRNCVVRPPVRPGNAGKD